MESDWADSFDPSQAGSEGPAVPVQSYIDPPQRDVLPTSTPPMVLPATRATAPAGSPRARAGLSIVMCAAGAGIGGALGGLPGAGAGALFAGATRNLYRAQASLSGTEEERGDAAKRLTLGVLGLAAGGFLVYKCFAKKDKSNGHRPAHRHR